MSNNNRQARIKIEDLPINEELNDAHASGVVGGQTFQNSLVFTPFAFPNRTTLFTQQTQLFPQFSGSQFSDRRLKTDIKRIGSTAEGYPKYQFKYLWDSAVHTGVMADEVSTELRTYTSAGFAMVDYSRISL